MPTRLRDVGVKQDQFKEINCGPNTQPMDPEQPAKDHGPPAQVVEILEMQLSNATVNRQQHPAAPSAETGERRGLQQAKKGQ